MRLLKGVNSYEKLSVKWKWSLVISVTIIFVYAIFAVLVYYSTQQVLLEKEESEVSLAMDQTAGSLELLIKPFDRRNVSEQINLDQIATNIFTPAYTYSKTHARHNNPYLSKISFRVFDPEGEEVYSIGDSDFAFYPSNDVKIRPVGDSNNSFVLAGTQPIYSRFNDELLGHIQIINSLEGFHTVIDRVVQAIYIIGILILILSVLLGSLVSDNLLKPIRSMKNAMNEIIEEPESESRLKVSGTDEIAELSMIYNTMVDRMQTNIESQKQFVEDVSHELRTPVAIVEGHLKLLERWGKSDPDVLEESIDASVQEITRMKSLVQEMLDLSRAAQVDIHYRHEKTNVKDLMESIHSNIQLVHPDFIFHLDIDTDEDPIVNMYRNHLEQVLIILIDNAVKYSRDRKEVHMSLATYGSKMQVAIQDFGEGITEDELNKIFDRFYRIDKARSRQKGGNGLGLSIAKQLVEGYQGKISVESIAGNGSIFRIVLDTVEPDEEI